MVFGQQIRVLLVDDDSDTRSMFSHLVRRAGHAVREATSGAEAIEIMDADTAVVLLDLEMPGMSGLDCLPQLKAKNPDCQIIMLSGVEQIETVVEAMRLGAFWYLPKRCAVLELQPLIGRAFEHSRLLRQNQQLRQSIGVTQLPVSAFVGSSAEAMVVADRVAKAARSDSTTLVIGESGTGKSMLARQLHEDGPRHAAPFIIVSCAALPRDLLEAELFGHERGAFTGAVSSRPGRIELAEGGTLFLDEIGDLPLDLQPKCSFFCKIE